MQILFKNPTKVEEAKSNLTYRVQKYICKIPANQKSHFN